MHASRGSNAQMAASRAISRSIFRSGTSAREASIFTRE
jgi:hypothetical protein